MRRAIIFGSSGFVGSHLLQALLDSPDYDRVTAIVRKPLAISHTKLDVLIGDYHTLPGLRSEIRGDDLFITLGTTRKNTPNQAEYYQVDHDYPVLAARIAKDNGVKSVFVVTAVGANLDSAFLYTRTQREEDRESAESRTYTSLVFAIQRNDQTRFGSEFQRALRDYRGAVVSST